MTCHKIYGNSRVWISIHEACVIVRSIKAQRPHAEQIWMFQNSHGMIWIKHIGHQMVVVMGVVIISTTKYLSSSWIISCNFINCSMSSSYAVTNPHPGLYLWPWMFTSTANYTLGSASLEFMAHRCRNDYRRFGNVCEKIPSYMILTLSPTYKKFSLGCAYPDVNLEHMSFWWNVATESGMFFKFFHFLPLKQLCFASSRMQLRRTKAKTLLVAEVFASTII